MSAVRSVAKNTAVLLVGQIISTFLGFFTTIYIARYLGVDGFGILAIALSIIGIIGVFNDLGLSSITTREVARDQSLAKKFTSNTAAMKIILGFLTFILVFITVNVINYPQEVRMVTYLITLSTIIGSFSGIFYSIFQAYEKMEYQSIGGILNSALMFIGMLVVIYYGLDVIAFAANYFIVSIVILIYTFIICIWKFHLPSLKIDLSFWKPTIIEAFPLSIALIFAVIHFRVDTIILSIMKGTAAVGFYNAPYRLLEFLNLFPVVFTSAIYPVLSRLHTSSSDSLKTSYELSFKYLFIVSLPIAVGTTLLANKIILLIYNASYTPSIVALQILIWSIPLIFIGFLFGTLISSINKQKLLYKIMFISMTVNILLNIILIPIYSFIGSSVVTVLSECIVFSMYFYYISKLFYKIPVLKIIVKPIIASAVMGLFIIYLNLNLFIMILLGAIVYFGVLIIIKAFSSEELSLFKEVFKFRLNDSNDN